MIAKQGNNSDVGYCRPPAASRFQPGRSGNPNGRPKGRSVTAIMRQIIEADDGRIASALARMMFERAPAGDFRFLKEILDRTEGKSRPMTNSAAEDGELRIQVIFIDKLNTMIDENAGG